MSVPHPFTTDRRAAARFPTRFAAQLASDALLVPVMVRNLSISGCRVEIDKCNLNHPGKIGDHGLLHIPSTGRDTYSTILPVVLRYVQNGTGLVIYGLEFNNPLPHQKLKLEGVLEAMLESCVDEICMVPEKTGNDVCVDDIA